MKITQRQVVSLTLGILLAGNMLLAIVLAFMRNWNGAAVTGISAIVTGVLFFAHLLRWRYAAAVLLISSSIMSGFALSIVPADG